MIATLVQIDAWAGATATPLRFASHDDARLCHLDGQVWWPAIAQLPTLRRDLFDGSFDAGSISSPSGDLTICIDALPALPALALHDSRARIWRGTLGAAFDLFELVFDGRVKEQPAIKDGLARLSIAVDDSWLDQPLLATYAGTGGAEGPAAMQGQVKPLALGAPRFAPATLVDAVDSIYQISGYGQIQAVETAFERLNRFSAVYGDASNFASLKAADIPAGRWATSLAGGYVRFGAPPEGMLSFHVQGDVTGGWSRLPGAIIARIATIAGGADRFATVDIAALNIARPWPLSIMVTDQTTARELIQRIAASINAVAYVDWLGILRVAPVGIGAPSLTMAADGSALPPVASIGQIAIAAPYWKIAQGAATTWQVHALSDIAFTAPLNPRGPYDDAESYREGDMVTLANGSQWLFVGVTPLTGSAPIDTNINWFRLSGDITAGTITYADGTAIEALKPAQAGATVGAPAGTMVGNKSVEALLNQLSSAQIMAAVGEYYAKRMETVDPESGLVAITEYANADGIVVARTMGAGPAGGFVGYMASEYLYTDNSGGNIRPIMQYSHEAGRWQIWDAWIDKLEIGSVLTGSIAVNAVVDGDTIALASPLSGNGSWQTAVNYVLDIPAPVEGEVVDWQVVAIVTGAQGFPSGDRTWNTRLLFDSDQKGAAGGQKSEDSLAMSGRANWGPGTHNIKVEWNGQSTVSLSEMNMTLLWFKR
ncbi:MAG: hypothetical protein V4512_06680 [Pseudomonadota bacterium]